MAATTFDDILLKGIRSGLAPAKSAESRKWFRDTAKKTRITPSQLVREDKTRLTNRIEPGSMYAFFYDPKYKNELPYYDRFPLIFPIEKYQGGFIGLNLHYLPPRLRAKLMDALYELTNNDRYNDSTKLELSYKLLNSAAKFRWFKPTVKKYLNAHVKSRFIKIAPAEWDIAIFLPVEQFEKASKTQVWRDSQNVV